ncbi:MAG: hypothetical protein ACM3VV_04660 [Deltaproteobacteria bacterium]
MEQIDLKTLKHIQQNLISNVTNGYKTYNNILILEYTNSSNSSKYYYVVLPGFTIEEFLDYIKLLKKCREPHPFSKLSKCLEIPYIHFHDFSKEEISEAVKLLKEYDIIKSIADIYPGEMRYDICNESVKEILFYYWFLHKLNFYISFQRLIYNNKPADTDKEYMKLHVGKQRLNHKLALIYDLRKKNAEEFEKEIQDNYDNIEKLKASRNKILKDIDEKLRLLKKNDTYILSIIKEICLTHENII